VGSLREFVRYASARPGALNFATGGVGSSNHIDAALFASAAKLDLVHVPYNGPSAGISAVAGGDAQMMIVSVTTGVGLAQGGKVRPLVVFSAERSTLLPDVPTGRELGLSGLDLTAWIGLMAPAGTPVDIVRTLNREIDAILASDETAAWAQRHGLEIARGSAESFARTVADDYARWGDAIRGMHVERQ
jgi:tripartite-type tricarboxylate transporter receptor subunit TctC